jgi:hypothetical protein
MPGLSHDRELERPERASRASEPLPAAVVQPGSLAWASAIGNQAVQALARQEAPAAEADVEEMPAPEPEAAADEPAEVDEAALGGLEPHEAAGLAALDEAAEDTLPE